MLMIMVPLFTATDPPSNPSNKGIMDSVEEKFLGKILIFKRRIVFSARGTLTIIALQVSISYQLPACMSLLLQGEFEIST